MDTQEYTFTLVDGTETNELVINHQNVKDAILEATEFCNEKQLEMLMISDNLPFIVRRRKVDGKLETIRMMRV